MAFVGSIDQGTSSTRFMIFDFLGAAVATSQLEHTQFYPSPGFVEHDPLQIWENTKTCIQTALEKSNLQGKDISAIGITNQRETTVSSAMRLIAQSTIFYNSVRCIGDMEQNDRGTVS